MGRGRFYSHGISSRSKPNLKIEGGRIVELDGKRREDFDLIDTFIANYGIVLDGAQQAMAKGLKEIANMMLTPSVPREEIVKICKSITPAKMLEVVSCMNVVEMMQCMQKCVLVVQWLTKPM